MASTTERALLKPPIWSGDGKDGAATMSEMAGQIMALRYRMEFERDRADKAEEELALLMVSKGGEDKGRASTKHRAKEEEEEATAVAGDPVHAAYIHKLERKLAKGGHLLAQEHRRIAQREEEQDWMAMSDTWADKLISAAQVPLAFLPDSPTTSFTPSLPPSLPPALPPCTTLNGISHVHPTPKTPCSPRPSPGFPAHLRACKPRQKRARKGLEPLALQDPRPHRPLRCCSRSAEHQHAQRHPTEPAQCCSAILPWRRRGWRELGPGHAPVASAWRRTPHGRRWGWWRGTPR